MPKARPYLNNGYLEADNNTAERAVKPVAIGRKNWMFAGSEGGGKAMAIAFTLVETAKMSNVDPQAWLHGCWRASLIIRSHASTSLCPGVTLHKQRNREQVTRTRAPSPDGHS